MADNDMKTFKIEDAPIIFRNFAGRETQYNREGDKGFCVVIDPTLAGQMEQEGWNVKYLKPREETDPDEPPVPYVQVRVAFERKPPRVVAITSTGRTPLNEQTIEMLDGADIKSVDLICRGYEWVANGKSGIKAYLKTMFVIIDEDDLERKYGMTGGENHDG